MQILGWALNRILPFTTLKCETLLDAKQIKQVCTIELLIAMYWKYMGFYTPWLYDKRGIFFIRNQISSHSHHW